MRAGTGSCTSSPHRWPSNLRAFGLVLDRSRDLADLPEVIRNNRGRALLELWRRAPHPFVLLAGELHRPNGGILAGLCPDWEAVLRMYGRANDLFDDIASASGLEFSTAWMYRLAPQRESELRACIAASQAVAGSA